MENENYYQKNLETGKLIIYTSKAFYDGLDQVQKNLFTKFCLWSRNGGCWISKGKAENCYHLKSKLNEMGFVLREPKGVKLSFEEQVNKQQLLAEQRVVRAEKRAENAEKRSELLRKQASDMASVIPFGQPILVGHHSEKRDRNYREKIGNKFRKSFEEMDKAAYYENQADTARFTASGTRFTQPKYLNNRIKESEKNIRVCERRLTGRFYERSEPVPVPEEHRKFYEQRIAEEQDKLTFYYKCMKAINPDWTPKEKKQVKRGKSL